MGGLLCFFVTDFCSNHASQVQTFFCMGYRSLVLHWVSFLFCLDFLFISYPFSACVMDERISKCLGSCILEYSA